MALPDPAADRTVVVTGASSGIGEQLARRLTDLGHGVTLVARRRDRLDALADELRRTAGTQVTVHAVDLADDAARARLIAALEDVDVAGLCNNAGFGSYGPFAELPLDRELEMVRLNVLALTHLTGAVLPGMLARGSGAVLNVASVAAFQPLPTMATYAATKAFVQAFSEAVHTEVDGTGVSVTTLSPGPVPTEFGETAGATGFDDATAAVSVDAHEVAVQAIRAMVAGKRTVTPGLAARAMTFGGRYVPRSVLLPASRLVTGRRSREPRDDA
jgi:short-subunit dehydrogenase